MMGKSDVQFGIRFSTWNLGFMWGKWGEISGTEKTLYCYLLFPGKEAERTRAKMIGNGSKFLWIGLVKQKRCGCNSCQLVDWEGCET